LYYHRDKQLDPDFVMCSASLVTAGITPIMEEGTCGLGVFDRSNADGCEERNVEEALLKF